MRVSPLALVLLLFEYTSSARFEPNKQAIKDKQGYNSNDSNYNAEEAPSVSPTTFTEHHNLDLSSPLDGGEVQDTYEQVIELQAGDGDANGTNSNDNTDKGNLKLIFVAAGAIGGVAIMSILFVNRHRVFGNSKEALEVDDGSDDGNLKDAAIVQRFKRQQHSSDALPPKLDTIDEEEARTTTSSSDDNTGTLSSGSTTAGTSCSGSDMSGSTNENGGSKSGCSNHSLTYTTATETTAPHIVESAFHSIDKCSYSLQINDDIEAQGLIKAVSSNDSQKYYRDVESLLVMAHTAASEDIEEARDFYVLSQSNGSDILSLYRGSCSRSESSGEGVMETIIQKVDSSVGNTGVRGQPLSKTPTNTPAKSSSHVVYVKDVHSFESIESSLASYPQFQVNLIENLSALEQEKSGEDDATEIISEEDLPIDTDRLVRSEVYSEDNSLARNLEELSHNIRAHKTENNSDGENPSYTERNHSERNDTYFLREAQRFGTLCGTSSETSTITENREDSMPNCTVFSKEALRNDIVDGITPETSTITKNTKELDSLNDSDTTMSSHAYHIQTMTLIENISSQQRKFEVLPTITSYVEKNANETSFQSTDQKNLRFDEKENVAGVAKDAQVGQRISSSNKPTEDITHESNNPLKSENTIELLNKKRESESQDTPSKNANGSVHLLKSGFEKREERQSGDDSDRLNNKEKRLNINFQTPSPRQKVMTPSPSRTASPIDFISKELSGALLRTSRVFTGEMD